MLAEPASAAVDLPSFPASAMDGFALRAGETPATLPVVARIAAGTAGGAAARRRARRWRSQPAASFRTGADSVVPIEDVEERDGLRRRAGRGARRRERARARRRSPRRRRRRRRRASGSDRCISARSRPRA